MEITMIPTRHLNGTSQKDIDDNYETMLAALREAIKVMEAASPNARDYYVQGPDAFGVAQAQHVNRILRVADVKNQVEQEFHEFLTSTGR
jgi:hypothetical protein